MRSARYRDVDGSFELSLPAGWETERDGEGGLLLFASEGNGLLHLMPFERSAEDEADPAEEVYAFLADQEIEIEEDEVADVELAGGGSLAICEYITDDDDDLVFWMVGVATAPGQLVFASYSCTAGEEAAEVELVREILTSLTFDAPTEPE